MRDSLVRFLLPVAVLGAVAAFSLQEVNPAAAAEGLFLGELAAAVLLIVAALAPVPALELSVGSVLAVTAIWALPAGSSRGAAVMLLLVATFTIAAVRRVRRADVPGLPFSLAIPLALGAQFLLRSELLFEPVTLRTLIALLLLPAVGGIATSLLARCLGHLALGTAGLVLLFGPGWNVSTTLGMIALAAVSLLLKRSYQPVWSNGFGVAVLVLLVITALLDAYPWRRAEPLPAAFGILGSGTAILAAPGTCLLAPETTVSLDASYPSREKDLPIHPISSLVLDSALSNAADLANGTPVAVLRLTDWDGRTVERIVRAGMDTGEWAAKRPDVIQTARLRSPEPWVTWIAGDFLGQRYRMRWDLPVPGRFAKIRVERLPDLPPEVTFTVHQVELRQAGLSFPLSRDDPFFGTLATLPLILGGFAWIHRRAVRQGAKPLDRAGTTGELSALAILVLLVFARPHLNLGWSEEILAAGLALVLAHRLARQLVALRPLLGWRLPDRPPLVFFLLPLLAYLAILPWSAFHRPPDGDEPYYLLITHSLAYDRDADLTNNYARGDWRHFMERPLEPQPGDPVGPDGKIYSRHNEALPLVLAPAYRLGGKMGALAMMAVITAALAWATLRLGRRYFPDRPAETLAAWSLFAFAPPLLLYSVQVWVEVPATLLLIVALDRILGLDGQARRARRRWDIGEWLGIGLPVLLLPLIKMRLMLLAVPLVVLAWWHAGRPKKPILILAGLLSVLGAGILLYNYTVYANPLKIHSWEEIDPKRRGWLAYLSGGLGLFYDTAFGLFGCSPIWLLVLPAIVLLLARRDRLLVHLAVLAVPYLAIVAPRTEWYGGWSPPFRYALIALPLLTLALVPLFAGRRGPGARALLVGLAAVTLALVLVWLVVPGWTYSFANGRSYPLDHLTERLGTDLARFFPSSVRLRPATWIWPPASLALLALVWWLPSRREQMTSLRTTAASLSGILVVLAVAAVLPLSAARLPTRTIELEDPQVRKSGGHLHPDLWIIERARYRGGWVLRTGERLEAPVRPGGKKVRIELQAELVRNQPVPFRLDIRAGDRLLAVWAPGRSRVWETLRLGPLDWPDGAPLVLAAHGPHPPGALNGVILDRVVMRWE
ncbi:MAG TPA: hypothetical protein VE078_08195 [Thermoanaerobaculia bacterium]|nr:hypothetical protein [Thermoanaerobaculia bacterium]